MTAAKKRANIVGTYSISIGFSQFSIPLDARTFNQSLVAGA
jgi:hypothetical protein